MFFKRQKGTDWESKAHSSHWLRCFSLYQSWVSLQIYFLVTWTMWFSSLAPVSPSNALWCYFSLPSDALVLFYVDVCVSLSLSFCVCEYVWVCVCVCYVDVCMCVCFAPVELSEWEVESQLNAGARVNQRKVHRANEHKPKDGLKVQNNLSINCPKAEHASDTMNNPRQSLQPLFLLVALGWNRGKTRHPCNWGCVRWHTK